MPAVPAELIRHLNRDRCVLFVGSGLSAWAGLPTWKRFLEEMVDAVGEQDPEHPDQAELQRLLEGGKYLEVADHCKEQLSKVQYAALMRRLLRGDECTVLLQEAAVMAPHQPDIRYHMTEALVKAGRRDEARKELDRLLKSSKTFPERNDAEALRRQLGG